MRPLPLLLHSCWVTPHLVFRGKPPWYRGKGPGHRGEQSYKPALTASWWGLLLEVTEVPNIETANRRIKVLQQPGLPDLKVQCGPFKLNGINKILVRQVVHAGSRPAITVSCRRSILI